MRNHENLVILMMASLAITAVRNFHQYTAHFPCDFEVGRHGKSPAIVKA